MTRRSIYYASFNRDANFYRYLNGEKIVSYYVCGADVSINGAVSADEFNKLLDEVLTKDGVKREVIPCRENYEVYYFSGWGNMENNYLINKTAGFSSVAKRVAEKVNKETYKMTRSEYGYNYFPERF